MAVVSSCCERLG